MFVIHYKMQENIFSEMGAESYKENERKESMIKLWDTSDK